MNNNFEINYIDRLSKKEVTEQTPAGLQMYFLYTTTLGKFLLNNLISKKLTQIILGLFMDSRLSKKNIKPFVKEHDINMNESLKEIDEFYSFNDFFARKLKNDSRMIEANLFGISSPADGKITVFDNVDESMSFYIKNHKLNLNAFLQKKEIYTKFKNASMAIIRLAPVDYHRFHFPLEGHLKKIIKLKGLYFSVSPIALKNKKFIFEQNYRHISLIENKTIGDYAMIEIGATFVGTIVQTCQEITDVSKGDEKGYFKFGGSTVVLLFNKNSVIFDPDLRNNTKNGFETSVKMGERIAFIYNKSID